MNVRVIISVYNHVHMHLCFCADEKVQQPTSNYKKQMISKLITIINNCSTIKQLKTEFQLIFTCKYIRIFIHRKTKSSFVIVEKCCNVSYDFNRYFYEGSSTAFEKWQCYKDFDAGINHHQYMWPNMVHTLAWNTMINCWKACMLSTVSSIIYNVMPSIIVSYYKVVT